VTLIQRFGSALNLNVHFHMLVPDGVYVRHVRTASGSHFKPLAVRRPELRALAQRLAERVGRQLERRGILIGDSENSPFALEHRIAPRRIRFHATCASYQGGLSFLSPSLLFM
jgi:hypothetical protein